MRKFSFPRSARLSQREQYIRLFKDPILYKGRVIMIFSKAREQESSSESSCNYRSRLGITIKGRLSSVSRVRLKRVIREAFRLSTEKQATDHNILIRPNNKKLDDGFFKLLAQDLNRWSQHREKNQA